ncbi:hypothetical protein DLAC_10961 [Tieghemostelium lacteum]|uniref:Uncharacterized protein n=1 Tax=Tieghemostelium lacteum TaxID=361077 RepID=A0A151Z2U2_TIELA|nr:hypothetical protein DLAC_10961 [Tieghemostelium lacteum]|eukprot:KYQ88269.1 hypothetical protein DLAC_10961 [Tieghemostelium lacteum]
MDIHNNYNINITNNNNKEKYGDHVKANIGLLSLEIAGHLRKLQKVYQDGYITRVDYIQHLTLIGGSEYALAKVQYDDKEPVKMGMSGEIQSQEESDRIIQQTHELLKKRNEKYSLYPEIVQYFENVFLEFINSAMLSSVQDQCLRESNDSKISVVYD